MGARTNYTIITTDNPAQNINVYAHWDGDQSVDIMAHAISRAMPRIKMHDISYATRIIIDQLTSGGRDEETGYGIYIGEDITHEEQYEHKVIDLTDNTVSIGDTAYKMDEWLAAMV